MRDPAPSRIWFWLLFACHLVIASTFITKYGVRYGFDPFWTSGLYCSLAVAIMLIYRGRGLPRVCGDGRLVFVAVTVLTFLLAVFMYQFDMAGIRNGRHYALDLAIGRLVGGEFPYQAPAFSTHSAFPGWILLATPFYLMGDSGVMMLLALPIFAWTLWKIEPTLCIPGVLLLVSAPQFLYDVAVRSDISLNMITLLAVIVISDRLMARDENRLTIPAGLITGFLLSSRGVAFVVFSAYIGFASLRHRKQVLGYAVTALTTFVATLAPFAIWDWRNFVDWGPIGHQIQLSHLPIAVLGLAMAAPFWIGRKTRSVGLLFACTAGILLVIVAAAAIRVVAGSGLELAIMENGLDVTYLTIPLPFLILAILLMKSATTGRVTHT